MLVLPLNNLYTSKAFTLIELVMIIVIVAILSIMVGPRFFSTVTYHQQVYYDEILNSLRYASKLAVGTGEHIQVFLSATSLTLQRRIEGSACNTGVSFQPVVDPAKNINGYVKSAPGRVTLNFSANWPLYFDGLGRALRAVDCTVINDETVTIVGGKTITVKGETGLVQ